MNPSSFIYSSLNGHLGCFHLQVIMNKICHKYLCNRFSKTFISMSLRERRDNRNSQIKHLRTYQNLFVPLHIFKTNAWGFQVFHILAKLVFWITAVLILLLMSSSLISSLISHFQILISHLYIFFRRSIYLDPLCLCFFFLKKKNWVLLIALSFCVDSK